MFALRSATRIAAFFSVGFVLIFMGKISKVELFHNYSRSIAEVSDRNSTAVAGYIDAETAIGDQALPVISQPRIQVAGLSFLAAIFTPFVPAAATETPELPETPSAFTSLLIFIFSRFSMAP